MLRKYIWALLWAATIFEAALSSPVPDSCTLTSFQILCSSFYVKTLERCILNSIPSDIFVKGSQICYNVHPDRCISADFCSAIQTKVGDVTTTTTTTTTSPNVAHIDGRRFSEANDESAKANPAQPPENQPRGSQDQPGQDPSLGPDQPGQDQPRQDQPREDSNRRKSTILDEEWPLSPSTDINSTSDDDDDEAPLLNTLGLLLFWTQFGLGLGLFVCLVVAIGIVIWCHKKNKHRSAPRDDPEQPATHPGQTDPKPEEAIPTEQRPTISGPINNLNSACDKAESDSAPDEESIYNEPYYESDPDERNPFQGWTFPSSFRPVGPPPPPPPAAIPMVVRPLARVNKATMTDHRKLKGTLSKGTVKARSEIRSGYMASPESSLERSARRTAGTQRKQQHDNSLKGDGHPKECPTYNLPPLPVRSSSLRHKKGEGKKKSANTADTMC